MRKLGITTFVAGVLVLGAMSGSPARADGFTFTFAPDSVAYAYNDGYWDNDHHWHTWHNARESREFRNQYKDRYHAWKHERDSDHGWHDR